jgi:hypothetical protein
MSMTTSAPDLWPWGVIYLLGPIWLYVISVGLFYTVPVGLLKLAEAAGSASNRFVLRPLASALRSNRVDVGAKLAALIMLLLGSHFDLLTRAEALGLRSIVSVTDHSGGEANTGAASTLASVGIARAAASHARGRWFETTRAHPKRCH